MNLFTSVCCLVFLLLTIAGEISHAKPIQVLDEGYKTAPKVEDSNTGTPFYFYKKFTTFTITCGIGFTSFESSGKVIISSRSPANFTQENVGECFKYMRNSPLLLIPKDDKPVITMYRPYQEIGAPLGCAVLYLDENKRRFSFHFIDVPSIRITEDDIDTCFAGLARQEVLEQFGLGESGER